MIAITSRDSTLRNRPAIFPVDRSRFPWADDSNLALDIRSIHSAAWPPVVHPMASASHRGAVNPDAVRAVVESESRCAHVPRDGRTVAAGPPPQEDPADVQSPRVLPCDSQLRGRAQVPALRGHEPHIEGVLLQASQCRGGNPRDVADRARVTVDGREYLRIRVEGAPREVGPAADAVRNVDHD